MPGDKEAGLLADCGKPHAVHRHARLRRSRRSRCRCKAKFRQGYLDVAGDRAAPTAASSSALDDGRLRRGQARVRRARLQAAALTVDVSNWYIGFNMLDPVVGKGDTPEQQATQPQAAPGDLDRHRLGGGLRPHLPEQGRRGRAGPGARRHLRLAPRHGRGRQPGDAQGRRRPASCAARSRTRRSCSPRPAIPTGATPRPAGRWC